ncbi:MAG TPA: hypothetical protein VG843_02525 [Rhizomicrobium sp.]|nr:hypothetical protein [Rhizomicrobium sp.]
MNKLPVADTIRFAYRFAFGELGTVIGLIWAPMLAIAILRFLPYGLGDYAVSPDNPAAQGEAALRSLLFAALSILLYACVNVAVTRQALGLRKGGAVFYFSLGLAEFRMAGAMVILGVILGVLAILFVIGAVAAIAAGAAFGDKVATALVALTALTVGACVLLVCVVRLGFLLAPITVAENRISFERGWMLTKGNFWRISAVLFAVTLPVFAVEFAALASLMGREFLALVPAAAHLSQEAIAARMQAIIDRHISIVIGVNLIVAPFSLGLTLAASAAGYKALSPGAPQA